MIIVDHVFICQVGEAYAVLSDSKKRQRYDTGQDLDEEGGMHGHDIDPNSIFQVLKRGGTLFCHVFFILITETSRRFSAVAVCILVWEGPTAASSSTSPSEVEEGGHKAFHSSSANYFSLRNSAHISGTLFYSSSYENTYFSVSEFLSLLADGSGSNNLFYIFLCYEKATTMRLNTILYFKKDQEICNVLKCIVY